MSDTYDFRVTLGGTTRRFTVPRSAAVSWEQLKSLISTRFNLTTQDSEQLVVRFRDERTTITVSSAAEEHYLEGHLEYWADEGRGFADFDAEVVKRASEQDNSPATATATSRTDSTVDVLIGRDPLYTVRTLSSSCLASLSLSSFAGSSRLALSSAGIAPVARGDKAWLVLPTSEREGGGGKVLMKSEEEWDRVGKRAVREVYERGVREGRWSAARFSFEPLPSTTSTVTAPPPLPTSPTPSPQTAAAPNAVAPVGFAPSHLYTSLSPLYPYGPYPPLPCPPLHPFSYPSLDQQPSSPFGPPKFPPVFPPPFEPGPVRPPYPLKPPHRHELLETAQASLNKLIGGRIPMVEFADQVSEWEKRFGGKGMPKTEDESAGFRATSTKHGTTPSPPVPGSRAFPPPTPQGPSPSAPSANRPLEERDEGSRQKVELVRDGAQKEKQVKEKEKERAKAAHGRRMSWGSLHGDEKGEGKKGPIGERIDSKHQVLGQRKTERFNGGSGGVPIAVAPPAAAAAYELTVTDESSKTSEAQLRTQLTSPHLLPHLAGGAVAAPLPLPFSTAKLRSVAVSVPLERVHSPSPSQLEVEDKLSPSSSGRESAFESVESASGSTLSWDDCGSFSEVGDVEGMSTPAVQVGEEEKAVDFSAVDADQEEMPELVPVYSLVGNSLAASAGLTGSPPSSLPGPVAAAPVTGPTMTRAGRQKFKIKVRGAPVKNIKFKSFLNCRIAPDDEDDDDMPPLMPLPPIKRGGAGFEAIYVNSSKGIEVEGASPLALVQPGTKPLVSSRTDETFEHAQELPELEDVGETKAVEAVGGTEKKPEEVKPSPVDGNEGGEGPPPLTNDASPAPIPSPIYSRKFPFIRVDAFDTSADVAPPISPLKPEVTTSNVIVCDPRWRAKLRASRAVEEKDAVVKSPLPLAPAHSASSALSPAASASSAASAPASTPPVEGIDLTCSSHGDESHSDGSVYPPHPKSWEQLVLERSKEETARSRWRGRPG